MFIAQDFGASYFHNEARNVWSIIDSDEGDCIEVEGEVKNSYLQKNSYLPQQLPSSKHHHHAHLTYMGNDEHLH